MPSFARPESQQKIKHEELARFFGRVAWARVVAIPFFTLLILGLACVEPSGWRSIVLFALAAGVASFFVVELVRYRRFGLVAGTFERNLIATAVGTSLSAFATGGLGSPIVYAFIPVAIVSAIGLPFRQRMEVAAIQLSAVALYVYFGVSGPISDFNLALFGGGRRAQSGVAYLYTHAAAFSFVLVAAHRLGGAFRATFQGALCRVFAAQDQVLDAHVERVRELTALSGEIAHELKNPLASVKGLASLLAHTATDAKQAERIGVLRKEVDRMQAVLEDFLNLSRPLVPLALVESDVAALGAEVALLHEGLADEKGVAIEAKSGPVMIHCDPRKLKQILINLVQNAIDASPRGAKITLEALRAADTARRPGAVLRVCDEGEGLDPSLGDVFRPGVTSKAVGSGIGLTVARALARQHGGELTLHARSGRGGTVAEVWLPLRPTFGPAEQVAP